MVDLIEITTGRLFSICALCIDNRCHAVEYLEDLEIKNPKEYLGIMTLLKYSANNRPPQNIHKCRPLGDGLFEFKFKHARLFFFYQAGSIIICTHGFIKQSQATPSRQIARARDLKKRYLWEKQNDKK